MPQEYKISELADKAGVTKRTIHYYITKGLIPPAEGAGVGSIYNEQHLLRVLLVKKLQSQYLPLEKIRSIVSGLSIDRVQEMLREETVPIINYEEPQDYQKQQERYVRLSVGKGIELHCPMELLEKYGDVISSIEKYARRLIDEL